MLAVFKNVVRRPQRPTVVYGPPRKIVRVGVVFCEALEKCARPRTGCTRTNNVKARQAHMPARWWGTSLRVV